MVILVSLFSAVKRILPRIWLVEIGKKAVHTPLPEREVCILWISIAGFVVLRENVLIEPVIPGFQFVQRGILQQSAFQLSRYAPIIPINDAIFRK